MNYTREKQVAMEAVKQAAELCAAVRAEMVGSTFVQKGDNSPVTIADWGAQALVCHALAQAFPQDAIVAEEDAATLRDPANAATLEQVAQYVQRLDSTATPQAVCDWIDVGGKTLARRYWTLDPIDGTKGFLRNDQYAVALALVVDGEVKVGVLACPALPLQLEQSNSASGALFVAVRGAGAEMLPLAGGPAVPLHVTTGGSNVRFVESVESGHGNQELQQRIAQAAGITQPSVRMDSQAKYGVVARGEAALYLRLTSPKTPDYRENIWDHAAGTIIVEEAGGRVTDMYGKPLDFAAGAKLQDNRGVVVSNGAIHAAVIAALGQA